MPYSKAYDEKDDDDSSSEEGDESIDIEFENNSLFSKLNLSKSSKMKTDIVTTL